MAGLIALEGGRARFVERLDQLFALQAAPGAFKQVEDIAGLIGQYAHGNEPSHHVAYLYSYAGQPWRTQERVRQITHTLYDDSPRGLAGNDDCGQMSAWYVWSALGFYPVTPGSGEYVIGAPHFTHAVIHLPTGKTFTVDAEGLDAAHPYIQSASLDGQPYDKAYLRHADVVRGGRLRFVMGAAPNHQWATAPGSVPYSMTAP